MIGIFIFSRLYDVQQLKQKLIMIVEQIYTGCLAEAAYYIESDGEAAIIDPLRETKPYLDKAKENNVSIKYVFETHFHADFVSGHIDLAKESGAQIVYGPNANTAYDSYSAKDGEVFEIGKIKIKVLHTPGHTLESSTYLLLDENEKPHCIFTGDTLFIGDVGRPDLAIKADLTERDLASMLYDSLHTKIIPLPDDVIVYPAHGAGSACGKNMSKETFDSLGNQKKTNYALQDVSREQFIDQLLDGIMPAPQYFPKNAMMNKNGYESFSTVLEEGVKPLSPVEFRNMALTTHALILDTRSANNFCKSHIPGSIFIGIDGGFAPWVGTLIIDLQQPILFIADEGREEEVVTRLSRVGYDNTLGYLKGGLKAWALEKYETDSIKSITPKEFEMQFLETDGNVQIVDVRKKSEYDSEHVINAINIPLDWINNPKSIFKTDQTAYIHCLGGYRSVIASSIWKARGIHDLINIQGGFREISETDIPKTEFVCPTTLL